MVTKTTTPAKPAASSRRTQVDPGEFAKAGSPRTSRFTIDPELVSDLQWTMEDPKNVLTMKLTDFPDTRQRVAKGEPMKVVPATVVSATSYLFLHAKSVGLGVRVRESKDGTTLLVKAKAPNQRHK